MRKLIFTPNRETAEENSTKIESRIMTKLDLIERVRDYLDMDGWKHEYVEERNLIRARVNLTCRLKAIKMYISFNDDGYTVVAVLPIKAEAAVRSSVMEYITRANYGLKNGNFEMDVEDGEIRYKCYVNVKGLEDVSDEIIDDSIKLPALMVDKYGDGMVALMFGFSDPATEIQKVEAN